MTGVCKTNESYGSTVRLIRKNWFLSNISVSIENRKNSFFWLVSDVADLLAELHPQHSTCFHYCMHGGKRDKQTAWWSWNPNHPEQDVFSSLALECDKRHPHEPWRPYKDSKGNTISPTKEEAAYPKLLCGRVACILKSQALERGFNFTDDLEQQLRHSPEAATRQLFASQPRSHKLKPLVSEYGSYSIFFPRASERRVLLIVEVCHHILSSHLLIFISSHIFSSSHLLTSSHIFSHLLTSSHIFSHLSLLPSCPLALFSLLLFYFSLKARGSAQRGATKCNPFARNEVRSSKTAVKLRFYTVRRNPFARNDVRSSKTEVKLRFFDVLYASFVSAK